MWRCKNRYDGSSPHAWGILAIPPDGAHMARFIPTCVGNTARKERKQGIKSVHPHMRGEYPLAALPPVRTSGSSPHAWGIHSLPWPYIRPWRFIPTCVGNTAARPVTRDAPPVHPHMRGEYLVEFTELTRKRGSSPHAWGILPGTGITAGGRRFIPTCVGNTVASSRLPAVPTVHPHMRGEYQLGCEGGFENCGSSPHAWGIPFLPSCLPAFLRFIPTCVGNTLPCRFWQWDAAVHPHMRGEYGGVYIVGQQRSGSSPHAWGIRHKRSPKGRKARFIPTCVGNTADQATRPPGPPVHPHMRGEYGGPASGGPALAGSSPHAWGIRLSQKPTPCPRRFIPTCVGNT